MFSGSALPRQWPLTSVLVAGGTGFLGRAFVRSLAERGTDVVVLTRDPDHARRAHASLPAELRGGDVTRPDSLPPALAGIDTVILSVQFSGYPVEAPARGRTFMKVDAEGTRALVDAARDAGVRKLVYVSGVGADPESDRAWYRAKGLAEAAVRESGLVWSVIRPSWVYGPDDVSLNRFVALIRTIPAVFPQLGSGSQRISPIYVDDLCGLVCEVALGTAGDGGVIETGGPRELTLDEIIRTVMRVLGREKPILHIPIRMARLGARVLEWLPGQIFSRDALNFMLQDGIVDAKSTRERFPGFRPRELETGLQAYLNRGP